MSVVIGLVFGLGLRSLPGATVARAAAGASTVATPAQALPVAYSQGPGAGQDLVAAEMSNGQAPVLVSCGAGQQTLVRQIWLNGQPTSQVECVQGASAGVVYPSARMRTVANPQVVYGETGPEPRVTEAVYRQAPRAAAQPRRSWQKTALVIGGSSAAGAGIGGIIGGKKGALIGAAIGGGGSSLFEAIKRR